MSKHTPGPWYVRHESHDSADYAGVVYKDYGDRAYIVAECDENWDESRQEVMANARLIAAAPEMLEALIEAHGTLINLFKMIGFAKENSPAYQLVSAAIAKAEGRE